jgi:hypothetical protein
MLKRLILGLVVVTGLTAVALWAHAPLAAQAKTSPEPSAGGPHFAPVGGKKWVLTEESVVENGVVRKVRGISEVKDVASEPVEDLVPKRNGKTVGQPKVTADPSSIDLKPAETEASKAPHFAPVLQKGTELVEESVIDNGVVRKVLVVSEVKDVASEPPGFFLEGTELVEESVVENGVVRKGGMRVKAVKDAPTDLQGTYMELHRRISERLTPEQLTEKCKALEKELNEVIAEDEIAELQKQLSKLKRKNVDNKGISARLQRAIEALERSPVRNNVSSETFKSL